MTRKSGLLVLCAVLALVVAFAVWDHRQRATEAGLVKLGDVSRLEITLRGKSVALAKKDAHWVLTSFEGASVADTRANEDLVGHLVDLIKTLSATGDSPLEARDAEAYGMNEPSLDVKLAWQAPEAGEEHVLFGHRNLSGAAAFAYFPSRKLLLEVPSYAVILVENKSPLDFRDRRITTFDADDVNDLKVSGKCGPFTLMRDGDRWLRSGKPISNDSAEKWLNELVAIQYDRAEDTEGLRAAEQNPVCHLELKGLRDRAESVDVFKAQGTLWARNSKLPGTYHLPEGVMKSLVPPR